MRQKRIPLAREQYLVPFILITSLFFLWEFAYATPDVLDRYFQGLLDITETHSAFIQTVMYMRCSVVAIPAGLFISRSGYHRGVVFGLVSYNIGSLLFIPGQYYPSFDMFPFAPFVIGCRLTFLGMVVNLYATELGARETAASRLDFTQSFNGLGCICVPVLIGLPLFPEDGNSGTDNVALPYVDMETVVLLVALVFSKIKLPEIEHGVEVDRDGHKAGLWLHKLFIFSLLTLLVYEIEETSINSFFISHVAEQGWVNVYDASLVLSFGELELFILERFAGNWIMGRVCTGKMLPFCAMGTMVTISMAPLGVDIMPLITLLCGHTFEAIMFPAIFALSLGGLGNHTKRASSFLIMPPVDRVVNPSLMRIVTDCIAMAVVSIVSLAVYFMAWCYAHRMPFVAGKIR